MQTPRVRPERYEESNSKNASSNPKTGNLNRNSTCETASRITHINYTARFEKVMKRLFPNFWPKTRRYNSRKRTYTRYAKILAQILMIKGALAWAGTEAVSGIFFKSSSTSLELKLISSNSLRAMERRKSTH